MQTFSVIIADDDQNVCDALRDLIGDDPRFEVRGVVHSGADAAELVRTQRVDLAVVDVQMPQGGADAIEAIHAASPFTQVVVFTAKSGSRLHSQLMGAGAAAILKKGDATDLSGTLARVLTN